MTRDDRINALIEKYERRKIELNRMYSNASEYQKNNINTQLESIEEMLSYLTQELCK